MRKRISSNPQEFKAVKTKVDGIVFDSGLEAEVYKILKSMLPHNFVRQHKLEVKPRTAVYPPINWRVDFSTTPNLINPNLIPIHLEAKGIPDLNFVLKVQYLEFFNRPDWERVFVIVGNKTQLETITTINKRVMRPVIRLNALPHFLRAKYPTIKGL